MNSIVRSWNRYQKRPKTEVPDIIEVGDVRVQIGDDLMAERKKKDLGPHLGGAEATKKYPKATSKLDRSSYNNIIRMLKTSELVRVNTLRAATWVALKRLGVKRDPSKAAEKIPSGSDQVDIGSVVYWTNGIVPGDRGAIRQLVAIDATACSREK